MSRAHCSEPWPDLRMQREGVGARACGYFWRARCCSSPACSCSYAVYRSFNAEAFRIAGAHTEIVYGSINTVLLLTSSLTMTIALRAATAHADAISRLSASAITAALGLAFLSAKASNITTTSTKHLFPGPGFPAVAAGDANVLGLLLDHDRHSRRPSFGGHRHRPGRSLLFSSAASIPVQGSTMEGVAIYWHFVDSVWLVLLPLALSWQAAHDATARRSMIGEFKWRLWKGPAIAWLALMVLFARNLVRLILPLGAGNVAVNLAIAAVMMALLVTFLMDLQNSPALTRIVAAAGLFWTILMFVLTFSDYLSRHY